MASKAAGFAGLLQLMFVAFIGQHEFWVPIFAFLAVATMTIGNLVALQQRQFVRLLAYSGIAQAGYILLPFALVSNDQAVNQQAFASATAYILIYGIMNLGRVRGRGRGQQAQSEAPDLRLRGGRADRALPRGGDDVLHGVARRRSSGGGVLGEDPDLRRRDRTRRRDRPRPRRDHGRELGRSASSTTWPSRAR